MQTNKEIMQARLIQCAAMVLDASEYAKNNDADREFDSNEYKDRVRLMILCKDTLMKPTHWVATHTEPYLAAAKFLQDMDMFLDEMAQQNPDFNWDGMYGPKTIVSDSLASLGKVAGAEAKNRLNVWAESYKGSPSRSLQVK